MAHGREVVNLIGLHFLNDADEVGAVRQVTVMQLEADISVVRVLVQVVDAIGIKEGGSAFDPVHLIAFLQQQFGQIRTVLPRDSRYQCSFHAASDVFRKVQILAGGSGQIDFLVLHQFLVRTTGSN